MKMKTINILLVLLMTFSFAANAHGDKNKDKGLFKGIDTPAAKVVLTFHQALETGNQKQARAQLADDVTQSVNDIIKKRYESHPELNGLKNKTSAHDFRRGFITHNAKEGRNTLIIAEMVGHSDPNSTIRYLKETEEAKKEIAQSVRFDVAIK
jgi:integrase